MIHLDPTAQRKPLPLVELPELGTLIRPTLDAIEAKNGTVATNGSHIGIKLHSDSVHLSQFFEQNWGRLRDGEEPLVEGAIVALETDSIAEAPAIRPGRRYIDPERTLVVSVGNEYYGNVKISVRGLCSSLGRRENGGGFLHGASMVIGDAGVVVCGTSGAGKTTATRALFDLYPGDVRIINDDWGWADSETATIAFTGEPRVHMKYRSVRAIAPDLNLSPDLYLSENYEGDINDPHARLLIRREEAFNGCIADFSSFDVLAVIIRDESKPFFVRKMNVDDVDLLEAAEYSAFYDRNERFMDGSLFLVSDADVAAERRRFRRLLEKIPGILVNNVGTPPQLARGLQRELRRLGVP